jgi:polyhydroxyalkanoate synthesis repressor PhaR
MEPVLIKRYDNRRLYNTATAAYVTLDDLEGMVLSGERFVVRDAQTGEDITRALLDRLH